MKLFPDVARGCLTVMLLVLAGCGGGDGGAPAVPAGAGLEVSSHAAAELTWETEWAPAFDRAGREGKAVMVDFYADWCIWCKRLDSTTYRDREVTEYLSGQVVALKLDVDGDGRDMAEQHGVEGLPTVVLFDASGEELGRIAGYLPAREFLSEVRRLTTSL